ncbi:conserved hypothetical protein [Vibrio chagasii]|nr:conserved hypothetical protein [Vibrio chagasii]CAH6872674.1 conserved hypothetical protein [Vibrio chagasii]CAH7227377.1 conserved hypothetical protein [Vibrio chagasii]CAH7340766.1 conserved hypothetical protein [Vibrio chagasii]
MKNYELESLKEQIHFGKTQDYFEEVMMAYQVGAYRSAVVMLWSVAVSDVIYKLQYLVDLYNDGAANDILESVRSIQSEDARSSSWELGVIDQVFSNTKLIDSAEYENLRYLQKQRHLCAHPVLKDNLDLHTPNKETVRALIRNTLEGLLSKPPFYTSKVISEILEDLSEAKDALNTYTKTKRYIESRYLSRMPTEVEFALFRTLWKLTFKVDDEACEENRSTNLSVIRVLTERHRSQIGGLISSERDYYSNVAGSGQPLDYLTYYLSVNENFYELLSEDAKLKIQHASENTEVGKTCGWYTRGSLDEHFTFLLDWIEGEEYPKFSESQWRTVLELSDSEEWETKYAMLVSAYYVASGSFDTADSRFTQCILPNLKYFNEESALFFLDKVETNNQVYWRSRAYSDHKKVKASFLSILPEDFDFEQYENFHENTREED